MPIYFMIFAKDFHAVGGQKFVNSKLTSWRYIGRKMATYGKVSDIFLHTKLFRVVKPFDLIFFTKPSPSTCNNDGI